MRKYVKSVKISLQKHLLALGGREMKKAVKNLRFIRAIVVAIALFVGIFYEVGFNYIPADADEEMTVAVVAHRGYSGYYPENTLSSFAGAINVNAKRIEFDVRKTLDGKLVVFHDDTLQRYGGDPDRKFETYTYEELLNFDVGLNMGEAFCLERIPTLEQTLALIKPVDCEILLELKDIGDDEIFVEEVYAMCETYGMVERIIFGSFRYDYLQRIKLINEGCPIMVFASFGKTSLPANYPADYYGINMKTVSSATIKSIHEHGAFVYAYGPKTRYQMLSLQRMGVDGIITDFPDLEVVK